MNRNPIPVRVAVATKTKHVTKIEDLPTVRKPENMKNAQANRRSETGTDKLISSGNLSQGSRRDTIKNTVRNDAEMSNKARSIEIEL